MKPPPRAVRRVLVDPLFVPLAVALAAVLAAVVAVSALLAPLTPRRRVLRLAGLALAYLLVDTALLLACTALWLRGPRPRGAETGRRWTAAHDRLLRWALARVMAAARATVGFRVEVDPGAPPLPGDGRPLILLARHAGPGDSAALAWLVLTRWARTPRVVLKEVLRWDPGLDVVLTRLGACFLPARPSGEEDGPDRIAACVAQLDAGDALLLFPEGGNWTPARQRRAVRRLWRTEGRRAARRAARMPRVLPPRPAGTAAALTARPDVDVVVIAHAGLDRLTSPGQVWDAVPFTAAPMRVTWWHVPAAGVPRQEDGVEAWLNRQWAEVDRWVGAGRPGEQPAPAG